MKNRGVNFLLAATLLFVGITIGFYLGRNYNHAPVQMSVYPRAAAETQPTTQSTAPVIPQETIAETAAATAPVQTIVNLNTADPEQLLTLPGIGPVLAQRIIDYRTEHGPFTALEELLNVPGIGTKRLEAILDLITVGG